MQSVPTTASQSVALAERAGALLSSIVPSIAQTTTLVQQIAQAAREQDEGVSQIAAALDQLTRVGQQNASSSEELASTAADLDARARTLDGVIAAFIGQAHARRSASPVVAPAMPVPASSSAGTSLHFN